MECLVCGRKLKKPRSIELGYGPICYKSKFGSTARMRAGVEKSMTHCSGNEIPGQMTLNFQWTDQ